MCALPSSDHLRRPPRAGAAGPHAPGPPPPNRFRTKRRTSAAPALDAPWSLPSLLVRLDVLMSSQRRHSPFVRSLLPPIRTQASEAWIAGDRGNEIRPFWTWLVLHVTTHRACPCCACQARGGARAKGDAEAGHTQH